jgi:nickel/cobalt transporter (NiCoT) family protein
MTSLAELASMYRLREHLPMKSRLAFRFGSVILLHLATVVLLLVGGASGG